MTTADLPALTAHIDRAMAGFGAAASAFCERLRREFNADLAKLCGALERVNGELRRTLGLPPLAAHLRRILWTGIARRHAERPPTRGFWLRRCWCLACRERRGLT